jgi:solute carrier family 35 protein
VPPFAAASPLHIWASAPILAVYPPPVQPLQERLDHRALAPRLPAKPWRPRTTPPPAWAPSFLSRCVRVCVQAGRRQHARESFPTGRDTALTFSLLPVPCECPPPPHTHTQLLFSRFAFRFPIAIALLQSVCTSLAAWTTLDRPPSVRNALECLPLAIIHTANVATALVGTVGLSVPMFIALRRFTLALTMVMERVMLGKVHSRASAIAVALMIAGAALAAANDLNFSGPAYAAIAANNLLTAAYLVAMKGPSLRNVGVKALLFYNASLAVPMLAGVAVVSGEAARLGRGTHGGVRAWAGQPGLVTTLALAASLGVAVSHATLTCTRVNDALTTNVVGSAKNLVMTVIGMVAFGDFVWQPWNVVGLAIGAVGTVTYTLG